MDPESNYTLSVIIPFFNEEATVLALYEKVRSIDIPLEIIFVNDGSSDNSGNIISPLAKNPNITYLSHKTNRGKGAAIRTAIPHCTGKIITIQDADLETNPSNLEYLIKPILEGKTQVVYGSRILGNNGTQKTMFYFGGKLVTAVANILYGQKITDEPTCYKIFDAELLKSIPLKCKGFEFCPEITAKISKRGIKIHELPMDYYPRSTEEGKKLQFKDGIMALWTLLKYRFVN